MKFVAGRDYPSTAKFLVALGILTLSPSSSLLAIIWQPNRDLQCSHCSYCSCFEHRPWTRPYRKESRLWSLNCRLWTLKCLAHRRSAVLHTGSFRFQSQKHGSAYVSVSPKARSSISFSSSSGSGNLSYRSWSSTMTWHVEQAKEPSHAPALQLTLGHRLSTVHFHTSYSKVGGEHGKLLFPPN